ncbi:MAG: ABC transporter permease [Chloroflexi bacterium]|nr:ABC transporter permease [Chloroflexota bacterium]
MPAALDGTRIVFAHEFRKQIGGKGFLIATLAIPVLLVLIWIAIPVVRGIVADDSTDSGAGNAASSTASESGQVGPDTPVGIVLQATDLAVDFSQFPEFREYAETAAGLDDLKTGEINELFVILPDYTATGDVEYYYSDDETASRGQLRLILTDALLGETESPAHRQRALARPQFQRFTVADDGALNEDRGAAVAVSFIVGQGFAIALIFTLIAYGTILLQTVTEEKENRMVEVLLTSASPLAIMTGKVLALGLAGLIQMSVWVAAVILIVPRFAGVLPDLGGIPIDIGFLLLVLAFFLAGYAIAAALMAGIGAATTSTSEAGPLTALVIIPLAVPFYAMPLFLTSADHWLPRFLSFLPITAATSMMLRLASSHVAPAEVAISLVLMIVSAALLLWLASRIFRAGLLLYGQRMSLRAAWAALRYGG